MRLNGLISAIKPRNNEYLSQHFWKERTFWSNGYFSCSIGNVSKEIIQKYIQEQSH
jgi:putative transposase